MAYKSSFQPIVDAHARVLILGSLPGDLSIRKQEYYAHPQNRFWRLLFQLFQQPETFDYEEKIQFLNNQGIALWDVCKSAYREGSMDTAIQEVEPNAIEQLLQEYPTIEKVIFNGQKALKLYDRQLRRLPHIRYEVNPSTSPANASYNMDKLKDAWKNLLP